MSILNPARLRSQVEAREARKIKVFEHILDMCYNKILITNQQIDECCCIFTCPSVVFGLPLFNLIDCIQFIMIKLIEKGFEVHLAVPNNIFISWKKESNPDYSRKIYMLDTPSKINNLALMPPNNLSDFITNKHNKNNYNFKNYENNENNENYENNKNSIKNDYKLFENKMGKKKEKNYRPVEDYRQISIDSKIGGYKLDDIDLFHSKLDELLT